MNDAEYARNAETLLAAWARYVASGGLDQYQSEVPDHLLDLDDKVVTAVTVLIGLTFAVHAAGRPEAAQMILSTASKSPDVAKMLPLALGLAKWAGADKSMMLRGLGCLTALTLLKSGVATPQTDCSVSDMVRDGAVWNVSLPGSSQADPVGLETLGSALATYVFPSGDDWDDLVGVPQPETFSGWAAYLYGGGLDKPIAAISFSLLGAMGKGGQLIDTATSLVVSAAICLSAHGLGEYATEILGKMEQIVRDVDGNIQRMSSLAAERLGPFSQLIADVGAKGEGATGCFTALALTQSGILTCLDPHHTLRKMAVDCTTRFAVPGGTEYTIAEFSRSQAEILRKIGGGESGEA